jgi:hypothetical protein
MPIDAVLPTAVGESNPVDEDLPMEEDLDDNRLAVNANGEMEEIELASDEDVASAADDLDIAGDQSPDTEAFPGADGSAGSADNTEEEKQEPEA